MVSGLKSNEMATPAAKPAASAIYPSLKGKRVVVTGGASGIGAALVAGFVAQGAETIFVDILERESADRCAGQQCRQ
jgi:FlaA1/EpsC-like NDP-sugar epimerase